MASKIKSASKLNIGKFNMQQIKYFNDILGINEQEPLIMSKKILNFSSKEYKNETKEILANDDFIANIIDFSNQNNNEIITRNTILSIGHISRMYDLFLDKSFDFIWEKRNNKKLIYSVARSIHLYPQFIKQSDYKDFLLTLSKSAPKKDCIDLLYIIISRLLNKIDDKDFLLKIMGIFNEYILSNPELYSSKNEYPKLIDNIKTHLTNNSP